MWIVVIITQRLSESCIPARLTDNHREETSFTEGLMAATRKCPYCGQKVSATATKCKHCGADLEAAPDTLNQAVPRRNWVPLIAALIVLIAIAVAAYYFVGS
jgi:zinc ribbon protein